MKAIICKKCGAQIDASLGECPNCGAVYYILPEDKDAQLEWAMSMDTDAPEPGGKPFVPEPGGKSFTPESGTKPKTVSVHGESELINAGNDELFGTRVWKVNDDSDATKPVTPLPKTPAPPVRTPAPVRPSRPAAAEVSARIAQDKQRLLREKDLRKKQLFVAAVALLAVLTLVLTIMGGAFDFDKGNDSDKMPNVLGYTEETATTILTALGLEVTSSTQADSAVAGTVISQSIKAEKAVKKGDKVTIVVSTGEAAAQQSTSAQTEYVEVPSVLGKSYEAASSELSGLGLVVTKTADEYSDEDVGTVIEQSPMKGAKIEKGDIVIVTVSKGKEPDQHAITVTAGTGGSISPKGIVTVEDGEDMSFTITPSSGYEIREIKVDGTSIGAVDSYTFTNVTGDHTIYAVFKKKGAEASPSPGASPTPTANPVSGTDVG